MEPLIEVKEGCRVRARSGLVLDDVLQDGKLLRVPDRSEPTNDVTLEQGTKLIDLLEFAFLDRPQSEPTLWDLLDYSLARQLD
jgi:hypothetical protein